MFYVTSYNNALTLPASLGFVLDLWTISDLTCVFRFFFFVIPLTTHSKLFLIFPLSLLYWQ